MNPKKYVRQEPDGIHWPDADVGDNLYYGIDFNNCINVVDNEEIIAVKWELEEGLTSSDEFEQDNIVYIKIYTALIGTFRATCFLTTSLTGKTETQAAPMKLTVY